MFHGFLIGRGRPLGTERESEREREREREREDSMTDFWGSGSRDQGLAGSIQVYRNF